MSDTSNLSIARMPASIFGCCPITNDYDSKNQSRRKRILINELVNEEINRRKEGDEQENIKAENQNALGDDEKHGISLDERQTKETSVSDLSYTEDGMTVSTQDDRKTRLIRRAKLAAHFKEVKLSRKRRKKVVGSKGNQWGGTVIFTNGSVEDVSTNGFELGDGARETNSKIKQEFDSKEMVPEEAVQVKTEYTTTFSILRQNAAQKKKNLKKIHNLTPVEFGAYGVPSIKIENELEFQVIRQKPVVFDKKFHVDYDPDPREKRYCKYNTRHSGKDHELSNLTLTKMLTTINTLKLHFEVQFPKQVYEIATDSRAQTILKQIGNYKKSARARKNLASTEWLESLHKKCTLSDLKGFLQLDREVVKELQTLIQQAAKFLGVTLYGKVSKTKKTSTWAKKNPQVKGIFLSCVKRILWDTFEFKGAVIEILVKRVARLSRHKSNYVPRKTHAIPIPTPVTILAEEKLGRRGTIGKRCGGLVGTGRARPRNAKSGRVTMN